MTARRAWQCVSFLLIIFLAACQPQAALSSTVWLTTHAHEYGFTMTNPPEAQLWTGLTYEPWHYRYVGVDLATYLHGSGYFLTEYLFQVRLGLPCMPGP
ncbi:MAG: D-alanyl-D-alanine carboxypeptidase family protein [Anaerolineales bacterium]